jgi:alkylation response protein AidB-like acyl-CoA dehydrogenase
MGVVGLLAPESAGGSGFDWETAALIFEEAGRAALPVPLLETAGVAVPAIAAAGDPGGVLEAIANGEQIVTVSLDGALAPGSAGLATAAVVGTVAGVRLYRQGEFAVEPVTSVDRSRRLGRLTLTGPGVALDGLSPDEVADLAALGAAAELVGLSERMLEMTVAYVKGRQQYGVAIGSFQAVKHHLANVLVQLEFARPAVAYAAYAQRSEQVDRGRAISMAKALASDAATYAARQCLQCHGAMGYTDEYDLQLWMKRAWALASTYGGSAWHRARVARELGI